MQEKRVKVFVCVPGVGKTYLAKMDDRFVDFDAMKARYKYGQEDASEYDIEFFKGNRKTPLRFDVETFIENKLKEYLKTNKILLFAPNPKMIDIICKNNIPYCLVFHSKDCVEEIRERMRNRGNQENFIDSMLNPIDEFYQASISDTRPKYKIELQKGEFLSDKIYEIFGKKE